VDQKLQVTFKLFKQCIRLWPVFINRTILQQHRNESDLPVLNLAKSYK